MPDSPGLFTIATVAFTYHAVAFDGSIPNRIDRATGWTGAADGKTGMMSYWVKLDSSTNGLDMTLFGNNGGDVIIGKSAGNKIHVEFFGRLTMESTTSFTSADGWIHVLAAWDVADVTKCKVYVNGASETNVTSGPVNANIDYTLTDWSIGGDTACKMKLSEFWWAPNQWLDITDSANRLKFRTATPHPENLGTTGNTPTGTAALVYLPNGFATVNVNAGTGGNMTLNGTPADSDGDKP